MCCFHSVSGTNIEHVAELFWVDFCGIIRLNEAKCEAVLELMHLHGVDSGGGYFGTHVWDIMRTLLL